ARRRNPLPEPIHLKLLALKWKHPRERMDQCLRKRIRFCTSHFVCASLHHVYQSLKLPDRQLLEIAPALEGQTQRSCFLEQLANFLIGKKPLAIVEHLARQKINPSAAARV